MINLFIYLKESIDDILDNEENTKIPLYHWSQAEPIFFEKMIERQCNLLNEEEYQIINNHILFKDILSVFKAQPITIKGAYNFCLKSIGSAMYNNDMIKSIWDGKDVNGFNVMLKINELNGEIINIGTGEDLTIKSLTEKIVDVIGYTGEVRWDTSKPNGTPRKVLNVDKIKSLGWQPKIGLREGVQMAHQWYKDNVII